MFICSECKARAQKWSGKCLSCSAWSSLVEAPDEPKKKNGRIGGGSNAATETIALKSISLTGDGGVKRLHTGIASIDEALGGGIVPGSLILLAGEPGIGKSTLVMQIAIAAGGVLYISGEESAQQVGMRLKRLDTKNTGDVQFIGTTDYETAHNAIKSSRPRLAIVDSIQTMRHPDVPSEPGNVAQIRAVANSLMELANQSGVPIIIIGHVTKDGSVAGPKTLEHLVDVVIAIEGERSDRLRFLRCFKNRFGPTDEVAVLEMLETGLQPVADPSGLLLEERSLPVPGSVVTCLMDGNRPILVEIQALTTRTTFGFPQRRAQGVDNARLQILLAVLGRRMGLPVDQFDVFVNVVGGLSADEPAADLAICMAIASSLADKTIPQTVIAFGEVGLSGEIRRVKNMDKRLKEAERQGFKFALVPAAKNFPTTKTMKLAPIGDIKSVLEKIEK
ncbi:MAG: DNA repair protein RadA [Candidatus Magasanikbacteria bacterium]|nr:DNA repair protein RadA [Candidatus Magasanikbacteria bacterium]